jgi:cyclin T
LFAEQIPQSNEGKDWFWYVDKTVSLEQLEQLTAEFLAIFDKCPTKLKRKIMSISATQNPTLPPAISGSLFVSNNLDRVFVQVVKYSIVCRTSP